MRCALLGNAKAKAAELKSSSAAARGMRPFAMQGCFTSHYALPQFCLGALVSHSDELFDILTVGISSGHARQLNICVSGRTASLVTFGHS